jgi:tubulin/FtsZ family protein
VATYESERPTSERNAVNASGPSEDGSEIRLRLGQDVRLVFAAVGGGAIRVGHEVARRHIRHLETVAINCDPRVADFEEYDQRIYLGPDSGADRDTGGSPVVGGVLARAAEPALQRIFRGATFVVIVGSLGGGAGSGAFPHILDIASRNSEVVSAFVIKPFRCEGERRALADRAIGRLQLLESFVEKRERGWATLQTLDNESLIPSLGRTAFGEVSRHWGHVLEEHIERAFLGPAEALLGASRLSELTRMVPLTQGGTAETPALTIVPPAPINAPELPPMLPAARAGDSEAELTFEIVHEVRPPTLP